MSHKALIDERLRNAVAAGLHSLQCKRNAIRLADVLGLQQRTRYIAPGHALRIAVWRFGGLFTSALQRKAWRSSGAEGRGGKCWRTGHYPRAFLFACPSFAGVGSIPGSTDVLA